MPLSHPEWLSAAFLFCAGIMGLLSVLQIAKRLAVLERPLATARSVVSRELLGLGTLLGALGERLAATSDVAQVKVLPVEPPEFGWTPPPGIDLAFDLGREQIATQLDAIDGLDVKAGVLVTAVSVAAGAFLVSSIHIVPKILITFALILATVDGARAFLVRDYQDAPNIERLVSAANYDERYIKEVFLPNVLLAIRDNSRVSGVKTLYLNRAVKVATAGVISALLGKLLGIQ
jgi:hypothetical protein